MELRRLLDCLEASRLSLHWWLSFFTWLVVIGVVSETVFVIWEYCDDMHAFQRGIILPPWKPSRVKFALEIVGVALVAIGVAGELNLESRIATVETKLEDANDRHTVSLQFALRESLPRTLLGYRTIDPFAFDNALRNKPRGSVEVLVNFSDVDAHGFGVDLLSALSRAGWDASSINGLPPETRTLWKTTIVRCHPWDMAYHSEPRTAVEAFLEALRVGTEEKGHGVMIWMEQDSKLPDDRCVVEVHPPTPKAQQVNNK
ncbi:MAG: hypothetical protein ABSG70_12995 [Terriglobales bacterium]|jgi:hypothetical protein